MSIDRDTLDILAEGIIAHAYAHYNDGGWDVVAECWDHDMIVNWLNDNEADTMAKAEACFAPLVDVWADRQADAINSAF